MSVKYEVLSALLKYGEISGEKLAEGLGVSRNAVWKAVRSLSEDGYEIATFPGIGYRIISPEKMLTAEVAEYYAADTGYRFEILDEVDSTNSYLKSKASDGCRNLCVIADRQTAGRGRFGRTFAAPGKGAGLYMSFILDPIFPAKDAVTARAAVAAARAVEKLADIEIKIKWVNDLFCGGKKLCGILTEGSVNLETGMLDYLIIGIGINLRNAALPEELSNIATSVEEQCGKYPSRAVLAAEILREFNKCGDFVDEYRKRQLLLGRPVTVYRGNTTFSAIAEDTDENCALILRLDDGSRITLSSGEVSVKGA